VSGVNTTINKSVSGVNTTINKSVSGVNTTIKLYEENNEYLNITNNGVPIESSIDLKNDMNNKIINYVIYYKFILSPYNHTCMKTSV